MGFPELECGRGGDLQHRRREHEGDLTGPESVLEKARQGDKWETCYQGLMGDPRIEGVS